MTSVPIREQRANVQQNNFWVFPWTKHTHN